MIKTDKQGIGINQSVPIDSMCKALSILLTNGDITRDEFIEILSETPRGSNRTTKMLGKMTKILKGNSKEITNIQKLYSGNMSHIRYSDLNILVIALSAIAYPAFYHLLVALAEQFRIQETVNRAFFNQRMADIYGGNRATALGVDAMIPMLIDSGFIERKSFGKYQMGNNSREISNLALEYWVRTDLLVSGTKAIMVEEIQHRPWNDYCSNVERVTQKTKLLKQDVIGGSKAYIKL